MSIRLVSALHGLGRVVRWSSILAFAVWLSGLVPRPRGVLPEGPFLLSLAAVMCIWLLLRRVRQVCYIGACQFMIHSGVDNLLRFGVWQLLRVGIRFWPTAMSPDYCGIAVLSNTYQGLDGMKRYRLLRTVRELERQTGCPVAKEAALFLEVVEAA